MIRKIVRTILSRNNENKIKEGMETADRTEEERQEVFTLSKRE